MVLYIHGGHAKTFMRTHHIVPCLVVWWHSIIINYTLRLSLIINYILSLSLATIAHGHLLPATLLAPWESNYNLPVIIVVIIISNYTIPLPHSHHHYMPYAGPMPLSLQVVAVHIVHCTGYTCILFTRILCTVWMYQYTCVYTYMQWLCAHTEVHLTSSLTHAPCRSVQSITKHSCIHAHRTYASVHTQYTLYHALRRESHTKAVTWSVRTRGHTSTRGSLSLIIVLHPRGRVL